MNREGFEIYCDLAVVGAGLAGMAATLFAANRNISTVQIGDTGDIQFTSGLMDLLAVHPIETGALHDDPWKALAQLASDCPQHPFSRIAPTQIRNAFKEIFAFLEAQGLPYQSRPNCNVDILTFAGTLKKTYAAPLTMWAGIDALENREPCCIVGLEGLKGFSSRQIAEHLRAKWPGLKAAVVKFPGTRGEVFSTHLSTLLENESTRAEFADRLKTHLKGARAVGIPAIIGLQQNKKILNELSARVGAQVFEVPTLPPSMAGIRLRQAFERGLSAKGLTLLYQERVHRVERTVGDWRLHLQNGHAPKTVYAKSLLIATGRFLGGGLYADRKHIRESLLDLPVYQPARRTHWHDKDFFSPGGHPINQAGLEIDSAFRPVDRTGRFAAHNLFAAGSILAHQDWKRMKCGSGLAVASAFGAVASYLTIRECGPATGKTDKER